jgi:hypothetical protein
MRQRPVRILVDGAIEVGDRRVVNAIIRHSAVSAASRADGESVPSKLPR